MSHDGQIVAIGGFGYDGPNGANSGHVRIVEWNGSAWIQKGSDLEGEAAGDGFGVSVKLSADGLTVAAAANGYARAFQWNGSDWVQIGSDIDGEGAADALDWDGLALSEDGLILAIGAPLNYAYGLWSGHVRVFEWNSSAWVQKGSDIDGAAAFDLFGNRITMSSNGTVWAASGYLSDANGAGSSEVRAFQWSGSVWVQMGPAIVGEAAAGEAMHAVALSGDGTTLVVGAHLNDGNGADSGRVRVYQWNGSEWVHVLTDIDGEAPGDQFGSELAVSEDGLILAVSGMLNDGVNGVDSGHVRVYRLADGDVPTSQPTSKPSNTPTGQPTSKPSNAPTSDASNQPTSQPTSEPSNTPSGQPTSKPSDAPTGQPTNPTGQPTSKPSNAPTTEASNQPTSQQTVESTAAESSDALNCWDSHRIRSASCADYSADDIVQRIDDTGNCFVRVDKTRTCVPAEVFTTCSND